MGKRNLLKQAAYLVKYTCVNSCAAISLIVSVLFILAPPSINCLLKSVLLHIIVAELKKEYVTAKEFGERVLNNLNLIWLLQNENLIFFLGL